MTIKVALETIFASPDVDLRLSERHMDVSKLSANERYNLLVVDDLGTRVDSAFNVPIDYVLQRSLPRENISSGKIYISHHSGYGKSTISEGAD